MPEYTMKNAPDPISKIRAALDYAKQVEEMRMQRKATGTEHAVMMVKDVVYRNVPALLARLDELEAENKRLKELLDIKDNSFSE